MLNRLLTPKEQLLLLALTAAMLLGAGALWFNKRQSTQESTLGVLHTQDPSSTEMVTTPLDPAPLQEAAPVEISGPPAKIGVAVLGAVEREGLYWLDADARVMDLLDAAGGAKEGAYLEALNRAARLMDATTLTVPWEDYSAAEGEREQYARWSAGLYLNPPEYLHSPWAEEVRAQYAVQHTTTTQRPPLAANASVTNTTNPGGCVNLNTATLAELETLPGIGPVIGQRILDYQLQHGFNDLTDLMNVSGIAEKRFAAIAPFVCL